ncbi:serine protease [Solimonas sp. K1W22B-7]|uniref:trypsin-like serine peptidase n=1 Tax=Solimonas sp. K1W22B-7 TaxID=2303331 RepID=UPI000E32E866|nr:serine protease [Solimonas sp. K1W22B-7]AXQ30239.1 serine protease [Solimonas sp. K1W22B-7]
MILTLRRLLLLPCLLLSLSAAAADFPRHGLPGADIADALDDAKEHPLQYAVGLPLDLGVADGGWDSPAAGIARWRLGIDSQGAESLALSLEDLKLPAGAELRWIGEDSGDAQGPLAAEADGSLLLPVVRGGHALLELRLPAARKGGFGLHIVEAQHGYRGFPTAGTAKGNFGTSGACNVDVACSAANDWLPQVRSVVLITLNNRALCTGTLVNNVRLDETPYILTANHCDLDQVAASGIRAYFNVNRGGCGSGSNGRVDQFITAKELVARNPTSDFALLQLRGPADGAPPVTNYNVYFAGWDVSGTTPSSGAAIHHPSGDDKKISRYSGGVSKKNNTAVGDFTVDAWEVFWNSGTTEGGSSGAALWNQSGRVIGTLSGGSANCSGSQPNDKPDYFGRLELAWLGEDKAIGNNLKIYLDPDNSGTTVLNGLNRGVDPPPATEPPSSGGDGGGGGGALPASLLALLLTLGALRRARR